MRYLWIYICVFFIGTMSLVAQSRIIDPFFGIDYSPDKVHFQKMPQVLTSHCAELRGYSNAWVYSHVNARGTEYFILYGYIRVPSEKHPGAFSTVLEDDDGVIVAIQGKRCVVDQWQFVFRKETNPAQRTTPFRVPDATLNAIAADLLETYARAFGGKAEFLQRVTQEARRELLPVLRNQLEIFEKQQ